MGGNPAEHLDDAHDEYEELDSRNRTLNLVEGVPPKAAQHEIPPREPIALRNTGPSRRSLPESIPKLVEILCGLPLSNYPLGIHRFRIDPQVIHQGIA